MSDAPVTSLLAVGRDVWVACGKQVHVIRVSVRVTSQQMTRLDITVVSVDNVAVITCTCTCIMMFVLFTFSMVMFLTSAMGGGSCGEVYYGCYGGVSHSL